MAARNRKVRADQLADAIKDILADYETEVLDGMKAATKEAGVEARTALKNESNAEFNPKHKPKKGRYGGGWRSDYKEDRLSASVTIWNARYPGLPHLLEYGHALRQGGRTHDHPHIKPVEDAVAKSFVKKVVVKIT